MPTLQASHSASACSARPIRRHATGLRPAPHHVELFHDALAHRGDDGRWLPPHPRCRPGALRPAQAAQGGRGRGAHALAGDADSSPSARPGACACPPSTPAPTLCPPSLPPPGLTAVCLRRLVLAQPVAEGAAEGATLGRLAALSWLGCSGRPTRRWWPPTTASTTPPCRLDCCCRPGGGVFAHTGWFAVAGFAQNHPAPPLPCLLPCLFAHPQNQKPLRRSTCRRSRPRQPFASRGLRRRVAIRRQPQKHNLRSGTSV